MSGKTKTSTWENCPPQLVNLCSPNCESLRVEPLCASLGGPGPSAPRAPTVLPRCPQAHTNEKPQCKRMFGVVRGFLGGFGGIHSKPSGFIRIWDPRWGPPRGLSQGEAWLAFRRPGGLVGKPGSGRGRPWVWRTLRRMNLRQCVGEAAHAPLI